MISWWHYTRSIFVKPREYGILTLTSSTLLGLQTSHSISSAPSKYPPNINFPSALSILLVSLTKAMVLYPCLTDSLTTDFPMYPVAPAITLVFPLPTVSCWTAMEIPPAKLEASVGRRSARRMFIVA